MEHTDVVSVMTQKLFTVAPTTTVAQAWLTGRDHGVSHLPVVDGDRVVGVLSLADLRGARTGDPVSTCMRDQVIAIGTTATPTQAASMMREHGIGCLPVVDGGRLVGIVTPTDLLKAGLSEEEVIGDRRCASCQSHHHVRRTDLGAWFCAACLERTGAPGFGEDIGTGD